MDNNFDFGVNFNNFGNQSYYDDDNEEFLDFNVFETLEESEKNLFKIPVKQKSKPQHLIKYKYAEDFVKNIKIEKNINIFSFVSGRFIYGDFIEAFIVENDFFVDELIISSLSFSQENIDSLFNLFKGEFLNKLRIYVSNYFFGHKCNHKLIKYAFEKFKNYDFDIVVNRNHTKIALIKTSGFFIVFSGSANLRSSDCIEQVSIQENEELYNYCLSFYNNIGEEFSTKKRGDE
jgi:hypothetical protein